MFKLAHKFRTQSNRQVYKVKPKKVHFIISKLLCWPLKERFWLISPFHFSAFTFYYFSKWMATYNLYTWIQAQPMSYCWQNVCFKVDKTDFQSIELAPIEAQVWNVCLSRLLAKYVIRFVCRIGFTNSYHFSMVDVYFEISFREFFAYNNTHNFAIFSPSLN